MGGIRIVSFLTKTQTFYVLTTDGNQPKGRPFGAHFLVDGKIYFNCGTFKDVFKQLTANPIVEILAVDGTDFLRYDGIATVVKNDVVLNKIREASPQIMDKYDKNGWEMVMRNSASPPLWRGRKHSWWYLHQSCLTTPAHV